MSSHQTKTIKSRLCWGQAPLGASRIWTRAHLSEEEKPKLLLNHAHSANGGEDRAECRPTVALQGWSSTKSTRFSGLSPSSLTGGCWDHRLVPEAVGLLAWAADLSHSQLLLGKTGLPLPSSSSITHHPSTSSFPARFPEGIRLLPPGSADTWGLRGYTISSG